MSASIASLLMPISPPSVGPAAAGISTGPQPASRQLQPKTHGDIAHHKKHECQHCSRSFYLMGDLRRHLLTHTGEKPFKCPHCPHAANRKGNMLWHMVSQHGDHSGQPIMLFSPLAT